MKKLLALLIICCLMIPAALAEGDAQTASSNFAAIRINEFMASNGDSLEDGEGSSPDWIELYNTSDEDIDLEGLCLSDGKKTLDKFVFPSVIIPAKGYLIIFASGFEYITEDEIHVPFKLSTDGERVVISFEGVILDIVSFDTQEKDISMSRYDNRSWRYTETYTPGEENIFDD
ncbi:MAG: lamin tail domain-containing protein [Clostridiales bacterium]|nr:lamin tail domain-containing protein [Clostridiales bacterium]